MALEIKTVDGLKVLAITGGAVDSQTAPELLAGITREAGDSKYVVLDMSQVDFMSSAGLRMLLVLYRQTVARRGRITLVGVTEDIREVMSHTGFLAFFTLVDTVEQAKPARERTP